MTTLDAAAPLVISSYTLGVRVPFVERVRVAAEAGFAGVGLRAENYLAARAEGLTDGDMREVLDLHHVSVMEVEYVTGWGTEADRDGAQREKEQTIFHMARLFGVPHINAGLLEKLPADVITRAFAELCRRAGDLTVALEFMPYSGVPDLGTAWQVLRDADRPNSGLLVDAWHWARSGTTADDLAAVPADRIVGIQLCDVAEHPIEPLRQESLHHRLPPGRGFGDVPGMLAALRGEGVDALITVEVISDEILSLGLDVTAEQVMAATREVLALSERSEAAVSGEDVL
jgi:sugar phosphate isomerase/epimerase